MSEVGTQIVKRAFVVTMTDTCLLLPLNVMKKLNFVTLINKASCFRPL